MAGHYDILRLKPDASSEEVAAVFFWLKEKAGAYAPGIEVTDEMIRANYPELWEAFTVLSDPAQRAAYDAAHFPPPLAPDPETEEAVRSSGAFERFFSVIAAIGLLAAIVIFLSFLGGYLF